MTRAMIVKQSIYEVGIGSLDADLVWESDPDEYGTFAHLSRSADGRWWVSWTDMEEADGSYLSVEVTDANLSRLRVVLP